MRMIARQFLLCLIFQIANDIVFAQRSAISSDLKQLKSDLKNYLSPHSLLCPLAAEFGRCDGAQLNETATVECYLPTELVQRTLVLGDFKISLYRSTELVTFLDVSSQEPFTEAKANGSYELKLRHRFFAYAPLNPDSSTRIELFTCSLNHTHPSIGLLSNQTYMFYGQPPILPNTTCELQMEDNADGISSTTLVCTISPQLDDIRRITNLAQEIKISASSNMVESTECLNQPIECTRPEKGHCVWDDDEIYLYPKMCLYITATNLLGTRSKSLFLNPMSIMRPMSVVEGLSWSGCATTCDFKVSIAFQVNESADASDITDRMLAVHPTPSPSTVRAHERILTSIEGRLEWRQPAWLADKDIMSFMQHTHHYSQAAFIYWIELECLNTSAYLSISCPSSIPPIVVYNSTRVNLLLSNGNTYRASIKAGLNFNHFWSPVAFITFDTGPAPLVNSLFIIGICLIIVLLILIGCLILIPLHRMQKGTGVRQAMTAVPSASHVRNSLKVQDGNETENPSPSSYSGQSTFDPYFKFSHLSSQSDMNPLLHTLGPDSARYLNGQKSARPSQSSDEHEHTAFLQHTSNVPNAELVLKPPTLPEEALPVDHDSRPSPTHSDHSNGQYLTDGFNFND